MPDKLFKQEEVLGVGELGAGGLLVDQRKVLQLYLELQLCCYCKGLAELDNLGKLSDTCFLL